MSRNPLERTLRLPGGQPLRLRRAQPGDMRRIQVLYAQVYGPNYPIPVIQDPVRTRRAIESDRYLWLVADHGGRIVASLVYVFDPQHRIAKAFGAVVSKEYRKHRLANTMMEALQAEIRRRGDVDLVYATTRTVTTAPQQLTENLGFAKLGLFPNAHKVVEQETHCLAAYFAPGALAKRRVPAKLAAELSPLHTLVRRQMDIMEMDIGAARFFKKARGNGDSVEKEPLLFETLTARSFIKRRFGRTRSSGVLKDLFVPFHEPNLLLITPDGSTEVFLHYWPQDRYSVILGGVTPIRDFSYLLDSVAHALAAMGVNYIELLVDAYSPDRQREALAARFVPSAYFPAMRLVGRKRWDYVIFSRSFEMLDFRNVRIVSAYRDFLKEYLRLWQKFYIEDAFA
ncbi:MAG: GNAT family N-acetyltransferase [Elusimicrobiota bacterium]